MPKLILYFLLSTLFPLSAFAQNFKLESQLSGFAERQTSEKIYIQYDRSVYKPGETIWFKAYLMTANRPSQTSRNFYIDWANDSGNIIAHHCYPIANGATHGQFEIPEAYRGKVLHVQAYTTRMLNFDSSFLYRKTIKISGSQAIQARVRVISNDTLCFFPEGGSLVTGLRNKIAFKAVNIFQTPVKISGYIQNSSGQRVDSFHSMHDGMGYFYLQPSEGESYHAIWKDETGTMRTTPLPVAAVTGVNLQISSKNKTSIFEVRRTENSGEDFRHLHIVITQDQALIYEADINLSNQLYVKGSIPISALPSGILRFTLFNKGWLPIAERICFINNGSYQYMPDLHIDSVSFKPGGLNVLTMTCPDSLQANLSLAVTDIKVDPDSAHNIISGLLLSSELKDIIHNPAYYFRDSSRQRQQYLDLVMLTNGWRRYHWDQIFSGKYPPPKYPIDSSYLYFSGKITNASSAFKKAIADTAREHLILIALRPLHDTLSSFLTLRVDSAGHFGKPGLLLFDSLQVSYQFSDKKMNFRSFNMAFIPSRLNRPIAMNIRPALDPSNYPGVADDPSRFRSTPPAEGAVQLKPVEIKAKAKTRAELLEEKYTTSLFKGVYGYNVDVEDDKKAELSLNILDYLQLKVPGLKIKPTGNAFAPPFLEWTGIRSYPPGFGYVPPQLYLNEFPVSAEFIVRVPVSDIAYVKAFVPPFGMDRGGAIAVYTNTAKDYYGRHAPSAIERQIVVGYNVIKEFYASPYNRIDEDSASAKEATLYWNPIILLSAKKRQAKIRFYNTNGADGFRILIEGFTETGKLVHLERTIKN